MLKKVIIFGLLAFAQVSLGMEEPISPKDLENEYAYFEMLEEVGMAALCGKPWRQYKKEEKKRKEFEKGLEKYMGWAKTGATEYAKVYGASFGLIFAHEFGHWAAARLLLKEKGFILISPLQFLPIKGSYFLGLPSKEVGKLLVSIFKALIKNDESLILSPPSRERYSFEVTKKTFPKIPHAVMISAGPLTGFMASYLLLKGNTFVNEYEKNGNDFKKAIQTTQEKSLFNNTQNFLLQLIAVLHIQGNLFENLYPWGNKPTYDGDRIFEVLNIKNPRPLLRKALGMSLGTLTFCALGKAIFDAWTK